MLHYLGKYSGQNPLTSPGGGVVGLNIDRHITARSMHASMGEVIIIQATKAPVL